MEQLKVAIRTSADNPRHHLWNNNGTWFIHFTVHPTSLPKMRVRRSLETKSISVAWEHNRCCHEDRWHPKAYPRNHR